MGTSVDATRLAPNPLLKTRSELVMRLHRASAPPRDILKELNCDQDRFSGREKEIAALTDNPRRLLIGEKGVGIPSLVKMFAQQHDMQLFQFDVEAFNERNEQKIEGWLRRLPSSGVCLHIKRIDLLKDWESLLSVLSELFENNVVIASMPPVNTSNYEELSQYFCPLKVSDPENEEAKERMLSRQVSKSDFKVSPCAVRCALSKSKKTDEARTVLLAAAAQASQNNLLCTAESVEAIMKGSPSAP